MTDTIITLVGNLVDDPSLRFTPAGKPVAHFTVASTPRTFDRQSNEWKGGDAMFLNCSVWHQPAEKVQRTPSGGGQSSGWGQASQPRPAHPQGQDPWASSPAASSDEAPS